MRSERVLVGESIVPLNSTERVEAIVVVAPLLFSKENGAAYIGVSESLIEKYIAKGLLRVVRLPRPEGGLMNRVLIAKEDLDRFVAQHGVKE